MVEDSFSEHEDRPVETTHNKGKRAKSMKRKKKMRPIDQWEYIQPCVYLESQKRRDKIGQKNKLEKIIVKITINKFSNCWKP